MKFNLYYSDLNRLSADKLILDLKNRDRNQKHIIISPDKQSLYYERRLFALLQEQSFFDVSSTTLSRFANSVIGRNNTILTKQGGVLIVKRILLENKKDLKSFGKSADLIGFAGNLFDTICMFKSCNIKPNQIEEVANETLSNKLKDIKLVYEKYEEYLQNEYVDSFNRLNLCIQKINKDDFINTNFYFVGFDDFTKQGYMLIQKLIKCSNSVNVATTYSKKNNIKHNHNLYLNSIYYNCIDLTRMIGVECNKILVENEMVSEKRFLSHNLLANKPSQFIEKPKYIKVIKYDTIDDEIKNTCLSIKYNIMNSNMRYKNFAIIVPELGSYEERLKEYFDKLKINYFIDKNKKLNDTMFSRFVSNLIGVIYSPNKCNVIGFLRSSILNIDSREIDSYITLIDKYEPNHDKLLVSDNDVIAHYFNMLLRYRQGKSNAPICELLDNIFSLLDELKVAEKIDNLMRKYYEKNDLENYRLLKQSYSNVMKIFDEIKVIKNYECGYLELNKFFDLFAENTSIVVPPIVADTVFVSTVDCESLQDVDYVFYLGFNEGVVPKYSVDSGIISDEDINKMPLSNKLNPTIEVINKRAKFKTFELIFDADKKAIISYPAKSLDGELFPNSIVNSIVSIYGNIIENGSHSIDLINNNIIRFDDMNFIYNNFAKDIAEDNYVKLLKYWNNYSDNKNYLVTMSTLSNLVGDSTYIDNMNYDNNIKPICDGLFINKNKIGISQIERFNTCPYMHFVDYGLRLQPSERNDISAIDVGNIIHEFVSKIVFRFNEDNAQYTILKQILEKEEYKYLVDNPRNNFVIKSLFDETNRIFRVLKYQKSISKFDTIKVEELFSFNICNIGGREIYLTGVIDRIDKNGNGIRVIDYKTGRVDFKDFNDVYYGNKIQVIVYLSALAEKDGLIPLGALYLPISNAFAEQKAEDLYQMQGIVEKSLDNLFAFDENLSSPKYASNIINISTTTKGEIFSNSFYKNMCLDLDDIRKLSEYVMNLVKTTINNISEHIINPNPINANTCDYCEYKGLCNFSEKYKNQYREEGKIINIKDLLGGEYE